MTFAHRASALLVGAALTSTLFMAPPAFAAESDDATMLLEGRLIQISVENGHGASATSATEWAVVTDNGFVPVSGAIPDGADEFSGSVAIPDAVIAELSPESAAAVDESAPLAADSDAAAEVQEVADGLGLDLQVDSSSTFVDTPTDNAGSYLGHQLYIAAVSDSAGHALSYTDAQVVTLSTQVRNYWLDQSEGAIPSFTQAAFSRYTSAYDCTTVARGNFWSEAAAKFSSDQNFFFNGGGHHLVILMPQACEGHLGSGLGTIGDSVDEGGVLHVSVGYPQDGMGLAHEIGHNLTLEHSNLTYCPSTCTETEYFDIYDVMGISFVDVATIPALHAISKVKLGFIPDANIQNISLPSNVSSQTTAVTIKSISVRNTTGTRVLRVADPSTGTVTTLEYRSGTGDDAGSITSAAANKTFSGVAMVVGPGVRVLTQSNDPLEPQQTTQVSWWNGSRAQTSLQAGNSKVVGPMTVAVTGLTSASATVNITLTRQTGTASIAGNVKNTSAVNLAGICVDAIRGGTNYGSATTNASGNFTISGVQAGTGYYLHYTDCTPGSGDYEDRWFPAGDTTAQATAFDVTTGQVVTGKNATLLTAGPFVDVRNSHPFFTEIKWMYTAAISTGTPVSGSLYYYPANAVSRSAMAAFLYREAGSPVYTPPTTASFVDVPVGASFYKEIEWMKFTGITTGTPDGSGGLLYKPADSVSRQSMSAFLYRLAGSPAFSDPATPSFTDVPTNAAFYTEVEWMKSTAITTGYPAAGGTFTYNPASPVTRSAMAAFLSRYDAL